MWAVPVILFRRTRTEFRPAKQFFKFPARQVNWGPRPAKVVYVSLLVKVPELGPGKLAEAMVEVMGRLLGERGLVFVLESELRLLLGAYKQFAVLDPQLWTYFAQGLAAAAPPHAWSPQLAPSIHRLTRPETLV
jgi:hypothetical protein